MTGPYQPATYFCRIWTWFNCLFRFMQVPGRSDRRADRAGFFTLLFCGGVVIRIVGERRAGCWNGICWRANPHPQPAAAINLPHLPPPFIRRQTPYGDPLRARYIAATLHSNDIYPLSPFLPGRMPLRLDAPRLNIASVLLTSGMAPAYPATFYPSHTYHLPPPSIPAKAPPYGYWWRERVGLLLVQLYCWFHGAC